MIGPSEVPPSPLRTVRIDLGGRSQPVLLKLESHLPSGSIKHRTAQALLEHLRVAGLLSRPRMLVESTSGNLGVSLAQLIHGTPHRLVAVVDPLLSPGHRARLEALGADLVEVSHRDRTGSFLRQRLRRVRAIVNSAPDALWLNQYGRHANPVAHYLGTGPEIIAQTGGALDAVFVGVSTGGTLAGVSRAVRELAPGAVVVAVDVLGSRALGQHPTSPRQGLIVGIGANRPSAFAHPGWYDVLMEVAEPEAAAMCHLLAGAGLDVGGSSGAVVAAACRYLARRPLANPVCICPDAASFYRDTLYSQPWLAARGITLPDLGLRLAAPHPVATSGRE
jgi:cysteine synthase